ncbi:MAG: carbohydrate ABC transporter substrate-binding protein, partial [Geminicoccales bacterium]
MAQRRTAGCMVALGLAWLSMPAAADEIVFLSTQLRPIEEAQKVRDVILQGFAGEVDFIPEDPGPFTTRMLAEMATATGAVDLVGAVHGELPPVQDGLAPVGDVMGRLGDRTFNPTFVELGKLGTSEQMYVPWIQASYIMAANRQALAHLPDGADIQSLTYAQLQQWAANVEAATGERKLGFPAGPKGLMHRFFQGYLYPSYTGGVVRPFKSPEAAQMWADFTAIWEHASPRSTSYAFMQEP